MGEGHGEFMRFGDFVQAFQIMAVTCQREPLPTAIGPDGLGCQLGSRNSGLYIEMGSDTILVNVDRQGRAGQHQCMTIVMVVMAALIAMMVTAAQQPGAGDVNRQTQAGDRNCLGECDRDGVEQAGDRLPSDQ